MTRDVRESLTALIAVLFLFAAMWLIPLALDGVEIPKWVQPVGFGLQVVILVALIVQRRRHKPVEKPE
ncbi:hypothetical protein [Allosphingosinicella sp.]|uniref:hypothetical protein n=1 Tax=Allosphingosinicella sp. TaxID=2823234 RepID=UPI00378369CA